MKNILLITASFLIIGCGSETPEDGALVSVKKIPEITVNDYIYTLGEVTIKWTAFKHSAKAQVGGKFKSAEVKGFTESTNLSTAISGVSFKIPVASTSTNDEVRDYKIVNSFFNIICQNFEYFNISFAVKPWFVIFWKRYSIGISSMRSSNLIPVNYRI